MADEKESVFMKHTAESGVSKYKEIVDQFGEVFFDLEKMQAIDLSGIYIIIPSESRLKKKTLAWGFSLAKHCNSKVFIAAKQSKNTDQIIDKISKSMGVEFEMLGEDIENIMEESKKEKNIVILPRDVVEWMKEEKQKGPLLII